MDVTCLIAIKLVTYTACIALIGHVQNIGTWLNIELVLGPDLTNQIKGVLLRFREEHIGVIGDIEAMFHQVKVPVTQCSFPLFGK